MVALRTARGLHDDLEGIASALETIDLRAAGDGRVEAARDRLVRNIRGYLLPRLAGPAKPLVVVFAGPTGSGKSTLVNSISGAEVSETGPIRPTTRRPVVLAREGGVEGLVAGIDCEIVTGEAPILEHVSLVDSPDIDSTETGNRRVAERLIDHADVVVFVTSALRYADEIPWEVLRRAVSRETPIVYVLNRVTRSSAGAAIDFKSRLLAEGLDGKLIRVPEQNRSEAGVPSMSVAGLRRRLLAIADEMGDARQAAFHRVLNAATAQVSTLADSIDVIREERDAEAVAGRKQVSSRAASLSLLFDDIDPGIGAPGPPWRRAVWLATNEPGGPKLSDYRADLSRRLVARLEGAIRAELARLSDPEGIGGAVAPLSTILDPAIESSMEEWLDGLHSLHPEARWRGLRFILLASVILGWDGGGRARALPGWEDGDVAAGMLDLRRRVVGLFDLAGTAWEERWRSGLGELDTGDIRDRLVAANARYQFADA